MSLLKTLLNAGVITNDAQTLAQYYDNTDPAEFLDGLEQTARCLVASEPPGLFLSKPEPWHGIQQEMQQNPGDLEQAFNNYLSSLDNALQMALVGAVDVRMRELRQWQQQAGQGKRRKTAQYIKALANLGYKFRWNLCTQEIEINGARITDTLRMEIRGKLRDANIWEVGVAEDAYIAEAWKNRYHPVRDYLTSLKFEGGDPIGELATYFQDEHGVFPIWIRRWLIGAVARVMSRAQNRVLVLDGVQDLGKSQFARWLANPLPEFFHEGSVQPDDRDCRLRAMTTWIWEINEFGNTSRRADREALKAFLTTEIIRERKPYGHYDIQGPAMASFVGTVNNEMGILSDPTGNRRFMIAHLRAIDWQGYLKNIQVDQIWAQAFELYLAGESWNLQPDEKKTADEIANQYYVIDIVEETIKKFFDIDPSQSTWWMSTMDIIEILKDPYQGNLKPGSEIDTRRLAAALTRLGLDRPWQKKIGKQPIRGYYGIAKRILPIP